MILNIVLSYLNKRSSGSETEKEKDIISEKDIFEIGGRNQMPVAIFTLPLGLTTKAHHGVIIRTKH